MKPAISDNQVNINYTQEQRDTPVNPNMVKDEDLSDVDSDLDVFVRNEK
jgi:hypothetical protein